jgi:orotate phosphoribosyltransferase
MRKLEVLRGYADYPIIKSFSLVQHNAGIICAFIPDPVVSVVGMGTSGAILISALLQLRPNWIPVLLRKPGREETTHRSYIEGSCGWHKHPILVVDDFVCSGRTMEKIYCILRENGASVDYLAVKNGDKVLHLFQELKLLIL